MSLFGKIGKALGKAASSLDPNRKNSLMGKGYRAVSTGGLSALPKGTALGKVGRGVANATTDATRFAFIPGNLAGAAVGNKRAQAALKTNLASSMRQVPVVMGAVQGFAKGGWVGGAAGLVNGVAQNYVAPEFQRPPDYSLTEVLPPRGSDIPVPIGSSSAAVAAPKPGGAAIAVGGGILLLALL